MGDLSYNVLPALQGKIDELQAYIALASERLSDREDPSQMELERRDALNIDLAMKVATHRDLVLLLAQLKSAVHSEPTAEQGEPSRLYQPPGHLLLQVAEFVCSKKTFKEVLEPTIYDLREEYYEALSERRPWKAQWVRARGYWSFVNAAGLTSLVSVGKKVVKLWKLVG